MIQTPGVAHVAKISGIQVSERMVQGVSLCYPSAMPLVLALLLALMSLVPLQARAGDTPSHGLLWHRSGLPAVFPLQVKTTPGRDYHLSLIPADGSSAVMAAYVSGGEFFRVLVPPGTYHVRFVYGTKWQNDMEQFGDGPETGLFELATPLTFRTRGIGTKVGHLVDLTDIHADDLAQAAVKDTLLCQTVRRELVRTRDSRFGLDLATRLYEPPRPGLPLAARTIDDDDKKRPNLEPRLKLDTDVRPRICY
ncbi:MAG: hypothetical protein AAFW87_14175 [Pseudomonadota bacterium]